MRIRLDIVVSCALQSALRILAYLYLDGIRLDPSVCNDLKWSSGLCKDIKSQRQ